MTTPLETLAYTLTSSDALAYEVLPRELVGWRSAVQIIWLGGAGAVVGWLPSGLVGPEWGWRFWLAAFAFVGLAYALVILAATLTARLRARRRIAESLGVELRRWGDHLELTTGGQQRFVAYEAINSVIVTSTHVFIVVRPDVVIVPLRAFRDRTEMAAFAETVDLASRNSAV